MPRVSPGQFDFGGGEFSPLSQGRVDVDRYKTGLANCLNWIPLIQGGITRRTGTQFVSESIPPAAGFDTIWLVPFEFSNTQAYMIEFGNGKVRFYKNRGLILNSSSLNITAATKANPVVITSASHGFKLRRCDLY
jgi:hypothetical protein